MDNSSIENSTCKDQVDNGGGEYLSEDELGDQLNNSADEYTNRQCSTATSKLQIRQQLIFTVVQENQHTSTS